MCMSPSYVCLSRREACPCRAHVELVMSFIARKPPKVRAAKEKAEEKQFFFLKETSLPHCKCWGELVNSLSILTTETSIQNRRKLL